MTQIWQSIAYLDPETGQPFCGWCQKFGHGIENCPGLAHPKPITVEETCKINAQKAVERLRIVEDLPSFSVEAEREQRSFRIAWITFWLSCGAAILALVWRLTR